MDKRRNSRLELADLRPSSQVMLDENGAGSRVSRPDLAVDTSTGAHAGPVSPISREASPAAEDRRMAQSTALPPSPIRSSAVATAPAATAAASADDSNSSVGMAVSVDPDSDDSDTFNPNISRFDRPDSSASTYEPHSPYRSRISRISFSYPRRPGSAAGNGSQPAHPYALYQQTMFEEPDEAEATPAQSVPIGFPGRTVSFRRRTGPEGEELDVMGPDGHAEQLPPYSRYPEAGPLPQKPPRGESSTDSTVSPVSTQTPSPANSVPAPTILPLPAAAIPPTVNAYVASEIPQPSPPPAPSLPLPSPPALPSPPQSPPQPQPEADPPPPPTPPVPPAPPPPPGETSDARAITSSASSLSEEKARKKGWKKDRKRRVICGFIPLWAVLLATFLSIFLAIIAGGVIGGLLSQQRDRKHKSPEVTVTSTAGSMWDASPIPAPTGGPPLPSGKFFFPLGVTDEQQRSCIEPSQDSSAWACNVPLHVLLIEFEHSGNYRTAKISAPPIPNEYGEDAIMYGAQPPKISPEQKMIWVTDVREAYRGPALHFQTFYDKIVVLDNDVFQPPTLRRRDLSVNRTELVRRHSSTAPTRHRLANEPGQEPWFCFWNSTYVEGFIYVDQPILGAETQQYAAMRSFATDMPTATPEAMSHGAATTPTTAAPSLTQLQARRALHRRDASASLAPTPSPDGQVPGVPTQPQQTGAPARFPFVLKVEERRLPNPAGQPYCQQMRAGEDGRMEPKLDAHGQPIIERIKEAAPSKSDPLVTGGVGHQTRKGATGQDGRNADMFAVGHKDRRRRRAVPLEPYRRLARRSNEPSNSCHCQWVSPQ